MKTISILGCGWLGLALGEALVKQGCQVKGSTTQTAKLSFLSDKGIKPYIIDIGIDKKEVIVPAFFESEVIVITLPFKRQLSDPYIYKDQIWRLTQHFSKQVSEVFFCSSTAVYPDTWTLCRENMEITPTTQRAAALLETENLLLEDGRFNTLILRLGGLIGGERHPVRFLTKKENVKDAEAPVNLIHREDCIRIIIRLLQQPPGNRRLNAVSDWHPKRKDYYCAQANKLGIPVPIFSNETTTRQKIVDNTELKKYLNFNFQQALYE